jgi:hypothetical protein
MLRKEKVWWQDSDFFSFVLLRAEEMLSVKKFFAESQANGSRRRNNGSRPRKSFPIVFCVALGEEDLHEVQGKKLLAKIVTLGEASVSGTDICFAKSFTI